MSPADFVVLTLLCAAVIGALCIAGRRGWGCGGGCSSCPHHGACHKEPDSSQDK